MKGKLDFRNNAQLETHIAQLRGLAKLVQQNPKMKSVYNFAYEKYSKQRSVQQNRYYHACIVQVLADYLGYTEYEIHEELKLKFNPKILANRITGDTTTIGGSTTELNTAQFEVYLEKIRIWALSELDCYLQEPNEFIEASP